MKNETYYAACPYSVCRAAIRIMGENGTKVSELLRDAYIS
jgi:hypothetical protein